MIHPLRPNQRQRTMAEQKTDRQMEAHENSRPKGSTEGRKDNNGNQNTGGRTNRKGETKEKGKRCESSESSESDKKMALQIVHMQCRETKQQNSSLGTGCSKIETGSDAHQ